MKNKKKNILIVSHDAGAAEIISAYVRKNKGRDSFKCLVAGPAQKIFHRKKLDDLFIDKTKAAALINNKELDLVLTGTGWMTPIEIEFIKLGREKNIRTAAYLDHWGNYRERFGFPRQDWKERLPDEIWVGDKYALALAKKKFGGPVIKLVPNQFFEEIKAEYKKNKRNQKQISHILFASEPLGAAVNSFGDRRDETFTEYDILDILLKYFSDRGLKREIIIRYHPIEKIGKYRRIIKKYHRTLNIIESKNQNMFDDLAKASYVIGMESMFLAIAVLCGKRVISFLPGIKKTAILPFKEIIRINDARKLDEVIK